MTLGMNDLALITAHVMIPVYEKQIEHYKNLLRRYKLQWSRPEERKVGTLGFMLISNAEASLMLAEWDLKRCEEVIARAEHANQSKGIQDAEAVVLDQGQPEGAQVQVPDSQGSEALPDPNQGQDA